MSEQNRWGLRYLCIKIGYREPTRGETREWTSVVEVGADQGGGGADDPMY